MQTIKSAPPPPPKGREGQSFRSQVDCSVCFVHLHSREKPGSSDTILVQNPISPPLSLHLAIPRGWVCIDLCPLIFRFKRTLFPFRVFASTQNKQYSDLSLLAFKKNKKKKGIRQVPHPFSILKIILRYFKAF